MRKRDWAILACLFAVGIVTTAWVTADLCKPKPVSRATRLDLGLFVIKPETAHLVAFDGKSVILQEFKLDGHEYLLNEETGSLTHKAGCINCTVQREKEIEKVERAGSHVIVDRP